MAIVNVTPDSFSDGGEHDDCDRACIHARKCIAAGASIIDVGGESTRPGAARVASAQQIARTIPVISQLAGSPGAISIDTTRADVALAALDAGASIINDVSAAVEDDEILSLAAERKCGLVLMHRVHSPPEDCYSDRYPTPPAYGDVVAEVGQWLIARAEKAIARGVAAEAIALDPGLGFGKGVEDNFQIMARIDEIAALGFPVLVSASRKSFLGAVSGVPQPKDRLAATIAANLAMACRGAGILRVHDVAEHAQAVKIAAAIATGVHC